jgi:hypothetical protein
MTETLEACAESREALPVDPSAMEDASINARARFFPAWWTHIGTSKDSAPLYRVMCSTPAELELARAVKPEFVDAEYFLCS